VPANVPESPVTKVHSTPQNGAIIEDTVEFVYIFKTKQSLIMRMGLVRVRKGNPQMGKKR
jgi:hypothetical protein